jgi:hypothetical protein
VERKPAEEPKAAKATSPPAPKKAQAKPALSTRKDIPGRETQKGQESWRAPFQHMAKGKVTPLTKADVEQLIPRKVFLGVSPGGDASGLRDADVLLLVEVPDSDACMGAYPTWKQLAERMAKSNPHVRVCAFSAETDGAKQWAGRHLAATSHPTFIAMPRAGGVYKFGGESATLELLKKFATEAFKQKKNVPATEKPLAATATRRGVKPSMDKPSASVEYYRGIGTGGPLGAVVDASVQGAANVARMAAPLALISLVVGFFMATALRILDLAFGESSAKVAGRVCFVGGGSAGHRGRSRGRDVRDAPARGGQPGPGHRAGRGGEAGERHVADQAGEGTRGAAGDEGESRARRG